MALNLARNAVENDKTCAFFSLEMQASQLVTRILASNTGIEGNSFKKPHLLTSYEWLNISEHIKKN
ncbi:replicative DNA helicase (plasmid) [Mesomycoplasma neurolyticum]|uniref:Replicative DNA helicase n=2 Tax=Mesomycoplasma neurolyticum TaxID=2120 RepID=A0A449A6N9_9BACT|nr:replicative DNA helicase [Mesomycoplasma neurolyticum]